MAGSVCCQSAARTNPCQPDIQAIMQSLVSTGELHSQISGRAHRTSCPRKLAPDTSLQGAGICLRRCSAYEEDPRNLPPQVASAVEGAPCKSVPGRRTPWQACMKSVAIAGISCTELYFSRGAPNLEDTDSCMVRSPLANGILKRCCSSLRLSQ